MNNIVAIVGRPNVGKSTLFNRLIGNRHAIVDDTSGVTRDRLYGISEWAGRSFTVIDTGGFVPRSDDIFESAVRSQVKIAMQEAGQILFMVDVTSRITDLDAQIANILRKSRQPVFLAVNKVDNSSRLLEAAEFYGLGFENTFFLSSISGSGTGELLDAITANIEKEPENDPSTLLPKIAIIGQPNVGKSSLINALVGEERNIVTDIPGTTRDTIHTHYKLYQKEFILIDTAGIRKKSKVKENLEFYSVIRAVRVIDEADVCLIMIDASREEKIEAQDVSLLGLVQRKNKGLVVLVNKWDLIEKQTQTAKQYEEKIRERTRPFTDYPILFISALNKKRIYQTIENALKVYERRKLRISTSELNEVSRKFIDKHPHPAVKGKNIKIKYVTQLPTKTIIFAFFCNLPQYIKPPYKQYIENRMRESFDLCGVPIKLVFRKK